MSLSFVYSAALVLIVSGAGFLYLLFGRNVGRRPQNAIEWLGAGLSLLLVGCAVILVVLASGMQPREENLNGRTAIEDAMLNIPAKDFDFRLIDDDTPKTLFDYKGKVILLNLWATWCGPCLMEIPELNRLQTDFEDRGLVILSISDEDPNLLRDFEKERPLLTVGGYVPGEDALPDIFRGGFTVRPTSYIIDRTGTVRRYMLGAGNYETFKNAFLPYL